MSCTLLLSDVVESVGPLLVPWPPKLSECDLVVASLNLNRECVESRSRQQPQITREFNSYTSSSMAGMN